MAKVYAFVADGMEEVECLGVCDVLNRAGVDVTLVSVMGRKQIIGSHGFKLEADTLFEEITDDADVLFLPGGMPGTLHLGESDAVRKAVLAMHEAGKIVAAICAAPGVLGRYGLLQGKRACSFPDHEVNLTGAEVSREPVVTDGNIVTSRGLGTVMEFGLKLLELLVGPEKRDEIKEKIVYQPMA